MSASVLTEESPHESAIGTLGTLIYADKSRAHVPEKLWENLLLAIAAGDQSALHVLYERTHRLVFTLIVRICKSGAAAEELTIDVFHDVWRRASGYDPAGGSVVAWIMNQARARALEHPAARLDLDEQRALIQKALVVLTPDERRAIESAFFADVTGAEVKVATRIRSGLSKLRQALATGEREP